MKKKKNRIIIKTITAFMLTFLLVLSSYAPRAAAEGEEAGQPSPVPTPAAEETETVSGTEEEAPLPTAAEDCDADDPEEATPTPAEEDSGAGESGILGAASPTPTPFQIQEAEITLAFTSAIYTGYDITQEVVSVEWNHKILTKGKDYVVTGALVKKEVGTYTVSVLGTGEFSGTATASWSIVAPTPVPEPSIEPEEPTGPAEPTEAPTPAEPTPIPDPGYRVIGVQGKTYTGSKITQDDMIVKYDGLLLAKGKDYTVKYKNNVNAGVASVVIKGKGNYKGSCEVEFTIVPADINECEAPEELVLSSGAGMSEKIPVIKWGGKTLKRLRDYEMSIEPDRMNDTGTYDVMLMGVNNYSGSRLMKVTIMDGISVKKLSLGRIKDQQWTGAEIMPAIDIKYKNEIVTRGIDVTYENNIDAGTAYLVITGNNEPFKENVRFAGQVRVPFKIKGRNISGASIKVEKTVYTGYACTPRVTVKLGSNELVEEIDYTVSYKNNKKVGTAQVIVKGCGGYTGKDKTEFEILPCKINSSDIRIDLPTRVYYEKGGPKPKPEITYNNLLLVANRDYTVVYSDNRAAGEIFKVEIEGINNFEGKVTREVMCYTKPLDMTVSKTPDIKWKKNTFVSRYISKPVLIDTNGKRLEAGKDYYDDYAYFDVLGNPIDRSEYMPQGREIFIRVKGKGNYSGTIFVSYRAVPDLLSGVSFKVAPQTYTGYAVEPGQLSVTTSIETGEYEILYYQNNVEAGTATMVVHGLGQYGGFKKVKFSIVKYRLTD